MVSQGSQHEIIDNLAQGAKNDPRQKSPVILGLIRNWYVILIFTIFSTTHLLFPPTSKGIFYHSQMFVFLQIHFASPSRITYIATQGFHGNVSKYVTSYYVQWSKDGDFYRQIPQKVSLISFLGNFAKFLIFDAIDKKCLNRF